MAQLSDLPVELLQRIAGFLRCSSALNLRGVSHKLHDACNDRVVFRDIALRSLEQDQVSKNTTCLWPEGSDILKRASVDDTIRVAYAVERAIQRADAEHVFPWIAENIPLYAREVVHSDVSQWLPQLLAWHYPGCTDFKATSLLTAHLQLGKRLETLGKLNTAQNTANFINVGFCIAWLTLHDLAKPTDQDHVVPFDMEEAFQAKLSSEYMFSVCWGIRPPNDWILQRTGAFDLLRASASIIPFLYSIFGGGFFRRTAFPVPSKMIFSSFVDIPWVFRGEAQLFSKCHIEKMTEPLFLTGIWMGYYTDQRLRNHQQFALVDPPMEDINIVAESTEETIANEPGIKGRITEPNSVGSDSHGAFSIHGNIFKDGRVEFVKHYALRGWEWQYRGIVIPFGIVGSWADMEGKFGGHFWIWKKDWCDVQTA